jgi:hypothetical protein
MFERNKMGILSEPIHHHQNGIKPLGTWKPFNKIKSDVLPCSLWYK